MRKEVIEKLFFALIIFSISVSFISAAAPAQGTCAVTTRAECVAPAQIIMGISSSTNSHGQLNGQTPAYNYVLCCGGGTGVTTCTGSNKIIGLSSSTNAHAQEPAGTTYPATNNICYGSLSCAYTSSTSCPATKPIPMLSLSSTTNAHIGAFADYSVKICCSGQLSTCFFQRAFWSLDGTNQITSSQSALTGQKVYLIVKGSGSECNGKSVSFSLDPAVTTNPSNVAFNGDTAKAEWTTEWQGTGILGTADPNYAFTATLVSSPNTNKISEDPKLKVTKLSDEDCSGITTCEGYTDSNQCNTNSPCSVNLAEQGVGVGVDCTASDTFCSCTWDTSTNKCGFTYSTIAGPTCNQDETLCFNTNNEPYCYPGNSCPTDQTNYCDNDGTCDSGEGCVCGDCNNQQDSCLAGLTCSSGTCYSATAEIIDPTCAYGYTLCHKAGSSPSRNYCYPGSVCPTGDEIISNNNGSCDPGEGCSSLDCKDGDLDTCKNGLYCRSGECYSADGPITLGLCKISQTVTKNCDVEPVGYKTITWTGIWGGTTQTGIAHDKCVAGGTVTVPCPAQIQLPFFDYLGMIVSVIAIALIYAGLIIKKKASRKK